MQTRTKQNEAPRMSDEAVKAKTGKTWKQWFTILDRAGGGALSHQEIVNYLKTEHGIGPWWQQMLTVSYEQASGRREQHQKPDGYQISVSRTIKAPLGRLFQAFADDEARSAWLSENGLTIRTATPNKSMRVTWKDGKSSLEISFLKKTGGKSLVVVQHSKLMNGTAATKMKAYWARSLDRLRAKLQTAT
jgi:Domain of unknown function (DUF4287)/Activator of Hsp90 ATPase homolog 1-like protein